jgi:hypothetical protein
MWLSDYATNVVYKVPQTAGNFVLLTHTYSNRKQQTDFSQEDSLYCKPTWQTNVKIGCEISGSHGGQYEV